MVNQVLNYFLKPSALILAIATKFKETDDWVHIFRNIT